MLNSIKSFLGDKYDAEISGEIAILENAGWTVTREDSGVDLIVITATKEKKEFEFKGTLNCAANALKVLNKL